MIKLILSTEKFLSIKKKVGLFNDAKDILKQIYETPNKLAIVTNTAGYVVEYVLKKFNISKFFHEIFSMGPGIDEKFAKPSPSGILSILRKFNYDHKHHKALMIGDSRVDIIAAKKANITACLITRDKKKYPEDFKNWSYSPDFIIESLHELLRLN